MPATRDRNQKFTFVYGNLYQINDATENFADPSKASCRSLPKSQVIKASTLEELQSAPAESAFIKIKPYQPQILKKTLKKDSIQVTCPPAQEYPLQSLKDNLSTLTQLHARLKFMLKELEGLVDE